MELTIEHIKNVTAFHEDWQAHGAIETLKWLEAGAPHKLDGLEGKFGFNMGVFVRKDRKTCGTSCCIAGAIAQFGSELLDWSDPDIESDGDIEGDGYEEFGPASLDHAFGLFNASDRNPIERGDLSELFYLGGLPYAKPLTDVTPDEAAVTLRRYLETGRICWPESVTDPYRENDYND